MDTCERIVLIYILKKYNIQDVDCMCLAQDIVYCHAVLKTELKGSVTGSLSVLTEWDSLIS
jgi:hypothetical protein